MLDETALTTESLADEYAVRVAGVSKTYGLWSSPNARFNHVLLDMVKGMVPTESSITRRIDAKIATIYREFKALEAISLDIKKGESWGFIGENGSGKSTLLKMISGNLRPSSGRIEVDGRVAILNYSSSLHGDFTGRENIYLKASVLGMNRRETDAKMQSIIDFADIGDFINQPVKTYSSGMTARLGFAIIAHTEADIIITDEALAVGDAFFVQKCMSHIRSFLKRGTFLFVSHSTNDVVSLCQKAVWLDHGNIRKIGSAKEVAEAYLNSHAIKQSERYLSQELAATQADEAGDKDRGDGEAGHDENDTGVTMTQPEIAHRMNSKPTRPIQDQRTAFLNGTQFRNDVEVLTQFDAEKVGVGGADIVDVSIEDADGAILTWIVGGELVRLRIIVAADRALRKPIIGFQVKDRLGQVLFADNTTILTLETPYSAKAGERFEAEFEFQMPLLPVGEYVITAAVADGDEANNAMLCIYPNAVLLRSITSGARHGLVGIPMQRMRVGTSKVTLAPQAEPLAYSTQDA